MGLFHNLRRGLIVLSWGAAAGLAFGVWHQRDRLTPLADLYTALTLDEGYRQKILGERHGEVVKIVDNATITLSEENGRLTNVRLTGIDVPLPGGVSARELAERTARLMELVLSNRVVVQVTHEYNPTAVLGLVRVGATNVNVALVESGVASAEKKFMNGLPLRVRYELLRAEREAGSRGTLPAPRQVDLP